MKKLLLALLFALPALAQYIQGGAVNAAPDTIGGDWTAKTSYSFTFAFHVSRLDDRMHRGDTVI